MRFCYVLLIAVLMCATAPFAAAQGQETSHTQSDASAYQRLDVVRSKLDLLRRTLNSAIAGLGSEESKTKGNKKGATSADDPRERLRGLEKEAGKLLSQANDLRGKQDRAEKYDVDDIGKLEAAVSDLDTRAQSVLRDTASQRRAGAVAVSSTSNANHKKKHGLFGLLGHGGNSDDKYAALTGTVAPGRDRELFTEATKQARKSNYEQSRYLYNTIITTYPDSPFLPAAKLAVADTYYLEGSTSALIQAAAAYQDWLTFFPTAPLADNVMLKIAEVEMRQMGLPDRDQSHARKAEQRLKVLLQQFPNTSLRPQAEIRLREAQESLGMHDMDVGDFYLNRYLQGKAPNPRGARERYREIVEKYPYFSEMDRVLFRLGTTYLQEEEPDEAAKYFQQLVREHPNSDYTDKAREQLDIIGASVPEPDPKKANEEERKNHSSFLGELKTQVMGTASVTVDKNGVLISRDGKNDLIEKFAQNGGQGFTTTPIAPTTQRVPPARPVIDTPSTPPANQKATTGATSGIKMQPTQPGPPASINTPTTPATATPAATAPTSTTTPPPDEVKP